MHVFVGLGKSSPTVEDVEGDPKASHVFFLRPTSSYVLCSECGSFNIISHHLTPSRRRKSFAIEAVDKGV